MPFLLIIEGALKLTEMPKNNILYNRILKVINNNFN